MIMSGVINTYRALHHLWFEQHISSVFYGQRVWFRWWLTEYIDSIFYDLILEYSIKSASSSFIQANTFIKLFFKYAHWLDTFKTSWPQLLRYWNVDWSDSSPSISSFFEFNDSPQRYCIFFFRWELVFHH